LPIHESTEEIANEVIIWGGTGQAKVVRPIIEYHGGKVIAVFDDTPGLPSPFDDVPIYQGLDAFYSWISPRDRSDLGFCVAIGNPHGRVRLKIDAVLRSYKLQPVTVVHPNACIASGVSVGAGSQVMAGAVISELVRIGRQCIINTNASVDHEDFLDDGVEVAPGATLCGLVELGVNSWIGAGATVLPRIKIGPDAIVGAGAVVTQDVPAGVTVVGVPARPIRTKKGRK
jgi:sugar O-acyltransferase (sialic acid O-acetyltransferase NeuD family)